MKKLFYVIAAYYLRHTSIEKGRYRLLTLMRPIGRKIGHALGWRRIRTKHGFLMDLNLQDWIPQDIFLMGEFEPSTTAVVKKLLRQGDVVVDVGANIGYFSLLFSQCVGSKGHVYSYEPVPQLASALQKNAELNKFKQISLSKLALSDHDGKAQFYVGPVDNSGLSSLRQPRNSSIVLDVDLARFDEIFSHAEDVALIKIDVEGAELAVLRGMEGYLRNKRPNILVEVTNKFLNEMGDSEQSLLAYLKNLGYHCYVIGEARVELLQSQKQPLPDQWNALFSAEKVFGGGTVLS
jgi:FkbM family methyltransferase